MSIRRYIPIRDTYIVSGSTHNYGSDEILEVGYSNHAQGISRALLGFENIALTGSARAILHLYLSDACKLPEEYTIVVKPASEAWEEGSGRPGDNDQRGATWQCRTSTEPWTSPGGNFDTIQSSVSQSFTKHDSKDISVDVTPIMSEAVEGFVIGLSDNSSDMLLSFYSEDTHTIYRPCLDVVLDDATYETTIPVLEDIENAKISIKNLQERYRVADKVRLNVKVIPLYPNRVYTTGSIYETNYILPENTSWGIKDEYTEEMVVDFGEYTKISADSRGNYFYLDMGMLEPERYYRILLQSTVGQKSVSGQSSNIFKVVRDGSC